MSEAGSVRLRLLIVDDHPVVRNGLAGMLSAQTDMSVIGEAADGEEAVAFVTADRPDLVLMDLRMPVLDGVGAIRRIRALADPPPILVLTTYDADADIVRAIEAGAAGYLLKDAPPADLYDAVRAAAAGGAPLSPAVAARLVHRVRDTSEALSARELDVLRLVARGASNREVGRDLRISEATVKTHLLHAFEKLEVGDRTSAVTRAIERGLIDLPRE
ncbi:MAG TPA: response regulator transcription factor [Candidatus Limnocylindrales bacterium]